MGSAEFGVSMYHLGGVCRKLGLGPMEVAWTKERDLGAVSLGLRRGNHGCE